MQVLKCSDKKVATFSTDFCIEMYDIQAMCDKLILLHNFLCLMCIMCNVVILLCNVMLLTCKIFILFMALQPNAGYGLLIREVFRDHTHDAPHSVGLLWTGTGTTC
jgi:hypothetical protein